MPKIIHLDMDAFFCAVEALLDPSLRDVPMAVGGSPEGRGVVASCSYAARRFGVHSAQPMAQAVRLCPQLRIVPARHAIYGQHSRQVMDRLRALTPLVEQLSIDEAFLDVSALPEPSLHIAQTLQQRIRDELQLPCSLGIATNKLVAKIATDVAKASVKHADPPNAILAVPPGAEAAFLAPLPTEALWGVGPVTARTLAELGIHTIGQIAAHDMERLQAKLGKVGVDLYRRAQGIDHRPIVTHYEPKSVSRETTFDRDIRDERVLCDTLRHLSESVARNLKRQDKAGATIKLKLRWSDFTTLTRQTTLAQPTAQVDTIYGAARTLLMQTWRPRRPVRLIGVGVTNLDQPTRQATLWDRDWRRESVLHKTVAQLEARYGKDVLHRGWAEEKET